MNTEQIERGEIIRCEQCGWWDHKNKTEHQHSSEHPERVAEFAECMKFSCWSTAKYTRSDDYCSLAAPLGGDGT